MKNENIKPTKEMEKVLLAGQGKQCYTAGIENYAAGQKDVLTVYLTK